MLIVIFFVSRSERRGGRRGRSVPLRHRRRDGGGKKFSATRSCRGKRRRRRRITSRAEWRHVAASNLLISLFQAVRAPLIVVIAGAYVDVQQLAYYVAAQRLANVMSLALLGISGFASPLIAQYFALGDFSKLQRLAHLSARGAFAGALVTALVLIGFGYELLALFGAGFTTAYVPLLILLCGELVAAATGPVGFLMTMTSRQRSATWIEAATSAIAIGFALALIPRYGILGAAARRRCGQHVAKRFAMFVAVWRQLGLRSRIF